MSLERRVSVITGASRGLGRGIAEHLAQQGSNLVLCARTADELERVAESIRGAHDVAVIALPVDVADAVAVAEFATLAEREFGPADAVINNAGVLGPVGRIDTIDTDAWRRAFEINVMGVVHMARSFAPQMVTAGRGAIVNLLGGGVGGNGVQSFMSAYTTAKGAVALLTETTARELAPLGIRVNAISPGPLATELMRPVLDAGPKTAGSTLYETAEKIYASSPPDQVLSAETASLIDYLLDDRSAGITGRLLSTRWNPVNDLHAESGRLGGTMKYTLRRIDGQSFGELSER